MSSYQNIAASTTERFFTVVAKASGDPIITGTVNYYLRAKSGANDGKWWRDSDQTWQASETANPMTHAADGHWEIDLTSSPFAAGIRYLEYVKESGNLHVPDSRHLVGSDHDSKSAANQAAILALLTEHDTATKSGTSSSGGSTDVSGSIAADAKTPKKVTTDGISVEARGINEQIAADSYLASEASVKGKKRGLVISKLSPPGAV